MKTLFTSTNLSASFLDALRRLRHLGATWLHTGKPVASLIPIPVPVRG